MLFETAVCSGARRGKSTVNCALSLLAFLAVSFSLIAARSKSTFTGFVTDDMCPKGDHSQMRMGSTDAECTRACVSVHGAEYVLYDGKKAYVLSDQKSPEAFAGQKVKVAGTLDVKANTLKVESIIALK
jgi:hypothetical protein